MPNFVIWIDRIFADDKNNLVEYWNRYIKHDGEVSRNLITIKSEQLAAARAACVAERLSQLVIKELRKIIKQLEPGAGGESRRLDLGQRYLPQLDLNGWKLDEKIVLKNTKLMGASFIGAEINIPKLERIQLQGADLSFVKLQKVNLTEAQLQGANFSKAQLQGATFENAKLQGAYFNDAELKEAKFDHAEMQGAILLGANLQAASLINVNLQYANLANGKFEGAMLNYADLRFTNMNLTQLHGASLVYAKLNGACLIKTNLTGVLHSYLEKNGSYSNNIISNKNTDWNKVRSDIKNSQTLASLNAAEKRCTKWINEGETIELPTDINAWQETIMLAAKDFPVYRTLILKNLYDRYHKNAPTDFQQAIKKVIAEIKQLDETSPPAPLL